MLTHAHRILVGPDVLPRFWIFMYRVSPFTYIISGLLSTTLANAAARCSFIEYLRFSPPSNTSCGSYLQSYIQTAGGYVLNNSALDTCEYCPISDTNEFLKLLHSEYEERWLDFAVVWVYVVFNAVMALVIYWAVRVPKRGKRDGSQGT